MTDGPRKSANTRKKEKQMDRRKVFISLGVGCCDQFKEYFLIGGYRTRTVSKSGD
jgi:hypothetical protein